MTRMYEITWFPTKERNPMTRNTFITLSKPIGKTSYDAKAALNIFISHFGNLKKNTIIKIIEMDENGQIGEPITPMEDSAIIPAGRR